VVVRPELATASLDCASNVSKAAVDPWSPVVVARATASSHRPFVSS
jgi:hypothetical protein